jgi:hypothetical protein
MPDPVLIIIPMCGNMTQTVTSPQSILPELRHYIYVFLFFS